MSNRKVSVLFYKGDPECVYGAIDSRIAFSIADKLEHVDVVEAQGTTLDVDGNYYYLVYNGNDDCCAFSNSFDMYDYIEEGELDKDDCQYFICKEGDLYIYNYKEAQTVGEIVSQNEDLKKIAMDNHYSIYLEDSLDDILYDEENDEELGQKLKNDIISNLQVFSIKEDIQADAHFQRSFDLGSDEYDEDDWNEEEDW